MPRMPTTRCADPTCGNYATHRGRCEEHQPEPWVNPSQHKKQISQRRWRKIRRESLRRDSYLCVDCGKPATEVDHVTEIADGGALYDLANLQSMCHDCHTAKTKREAARRRTQRERTAR